MRVQSRVWVGLVGFAIGCGGSAPRPGAAPPPETPEEPRPKEAGDAETMTQQPSSFEEAPASEPGEAEDMPGSWDDEADFLERFRTAEAELLAAGNACSRACRALRSMQRAADRFCALSTTEEERRRCDDVRDRYRRARERVRDACGSCPGGPVLNDAPG